MCKYCESPAITLPVLPCGNGDKKLSAIIMKPPDDEEYGIVCMVNHSAYGFFEINYCPVCGANLNVIERENHDE